MGTWLRNALHTGGTPSSHSVFHVVHNTDVKSSTLATPPGPITWSRKEVLRMAHAYKVLYACWRVNTLEMRCCRMGATERGFRAHIKHKLRPAGRTHDATVALEVSYIAIETLASVVTRNRISSLMAWQATNFWVSLFSYQNNYTTIHTSRMLLGFKTQLTSYLSLGELKRLWGKGNVWIDLQKP
jgi:hypothetical protein